MSLVFGFKMQMGVKGFWLGFLLALICLDLFVGYLVIWADWQPKVKSQEATVEGESNGKDLRKSAVINESEEST